MRMRNEVVTLFGDDIGSTSYPPRPSPKHSMFASMEWPAKGEQGHLAVGGTRQLSDHARLRGKWGTQGLLALALEVAGDKSSMTFSTELSSSAPKFGVTVALSP